MLKVFFHKTIYYLLKLIFPEHGSCKIHLVGFAKPSCCNSIYNFNHIDWKITDKWVQMFPTSFLTTLWSYACKISTVKQKSNKETTNWHWSRAGALPSRPPFMSTQLHRYSWIKSVKKHVKCLFNEPSWKKIFTWLDLQSTSAHRWSGSPITTKGHLLSGTFRTTETPKILRTANWITLAIIFVNHLFTAWYLCKPSVYYTALM